MGLGAGLGSGLGPGLGLGLGLGSGLASPCSWLTLTMHAALCAPDVISHSPPDETVDEAPPAGAGASAHTAPRPTASSAVQLG